jgi:HipA-like protein
LPAHSGKTLYLYLPIESELVPVGVLSQEDKEFVFRYAQEFFSRTDLPALSAFPDRAREYRSPVLWPFFEVRLPPLDRPDVAAVIKARRIDPDDALALLATIGLKTLTTPYEFRLEKVRPTDTTYKVATT